MKTIFIVDDNDTNLMMAKTALDGAYKTFAFPSAAKMFKLAQNITPDLILLDIDMPGMDGYQTMATLRSDEKLKDIPVIFLTAKQDEESELKGLDMGAVDFIHKPFSTGVLIKRVEAHIETDKLIKKSLKVMRDIHIAAGGVLAETEQQDITDSLDLSPREKEIFDMLLTDASRKQIAQTLNMKVETINQHVKNIYRKLGIQSRAELLTKYKK